ncbi:MAG TPA: LysR family transcriptional regulator [Solirubrobacteraceae bacterium]|nr:LysR family transcriptional regulator [Solirubrobacteraceae bacterium]
MEMHQLRYLRSVVRSGSVTRAAELEHVSQPSISKQIKLLERELGAALFHRVGRRVVPTEAGTLLAECAERVFEEIASTTGTLAELHASLRGSLRLCATETLTDNLLPPVLARLRSRNPAIHLTIEMLGTDDAVARILADELDLALVVLPLADSRLEIQTLFQEEIRFAVPLAHAWAERGKVGLAEALAEPELLLSMPGHGLRAQLEQEAQARGLTLQSRIDMRSQHALLNLVVFGAGVAFAPRMSVDRYERRLAILQLQPPLTREIGWIVRRGRRIPPIAHALLALIREEAGVT